MGVPACRGCYECIFVALPSIAHLGHVHDTRTRVVASGGTRSISMKHINMIVARKCGIRYGALSLALLLAYPALAFKGKKLANDAKID
jgi:hypothetical protein